MTSLNDTPKSNRLHIGIFGKTNSGKSSFINAFTKQQVSIVSNEAGTTTDPVYKPMEINPIGACVIIDTGGFADQSMLGENRLEKTRQAAEKSDIAVILISAEEMAGITSVVNRVMNHTENLTEETETVKGDSGNFTECFPEEAKWYKIFKEKNTPVLFVLSKSDTCVKEQVQKMTILVSDSTGEETIAVSALNGDGMDKIKEALVRLIPEDFGERSITGDLAGEKDLVLLVMPQDIQAPKGRLILPQVQTIRELLDKKCIVMSVTTDRFTAALSTLKNPPKLIITDSQVFAYVCENKPKESMLTSFSVLFAAHKGDISYYIEGAKAIENLSENSRVLIAECCTHAPLTEDIGREKIPGMLKKRFGDSLRIDIVSGADFPKDLFKYDLVIQCGACMFNRKYVLSRIDRAKVQKVPMTNYGIVIAHLTGILDQVAVPYN